MQLHLSVDTVISSDCREKCKTLSNVTFFNDDCCEMKKSNKYEMIKLLELSS